MVSVGLVYKVAREGGDAEDIRRLLAITWRTWGSEPLNPNSITRTWSLDLGWLSPNDSEVLLSKLIAKGWLISSKTGLSTKSNLIGVNVPLGWYPRQRILDNPPLFKSDENEAVEEFKDGEIKGNFVVSEEKANESIEQPSEKETYDVPALLIMISKQAKMPKQEIMKRAQRKRKTLGFVTIWMSLFLVAKELGLDIKKIVEKN